ncbi:O-antigen ligase family protein [bacterium]|nr:O-antigen ligase family protein [bacterium]
MKMLLLALMGLGCGFMLFSALAIDVPLMQTLVVICALMLPFVFIWQDLSRDILIAVLTLTLAFNVDQTLNLHETHVGGAQGLVVSVNGISLILLLMLYFIDLYRNRDKTPSALALYMAPLTGILLMCLFSMFRAPDRMLGLYETLEFLKMAGIFWYIANAVRDKRTFHFIIIILVAGLCFESLIALAQKATGSTLNLKILGGADSAAVQRIEGSAVYRPGGTLGGSNALAWYLDFLLPLILALILRKSRPAIRISLIAVFITGLAALILTLSRGGWLGFLIGASLVASFHFRHIPPLRRLYLSILFILCIALSGLFLFKIDNPIRTRLMANDRGSALVRIPLMHVALRMIRHSPVLGNGVNNYTLVHQNFDDTPEQVSIYFPYPVHNMYLQTAAEIGLPGLAFFIWFLIAVYAGIWKTIPSAEITDSAFLVGVTGGIAAALVQGLVENSTIGSYHLMPLWFLSAAAAGRILHYRAASPEPDAGRRTA